MGGLQRVPSIVEMIIIKETSSIIDEDFIKNLKLMLCAVTILSFFRVLEKL